MTTDIDLDSIKSVFFTEAYQLLADVEGFILQLEKSPGDTELLNAAFRSIHTIKGSSGVFGFSNITHFVHNLETVLDRVRNGELAFDLQMGNLVLACCDHIQLLVSSLEAGGEHADLDNAAKKQEASLSAQLQNYLLDEAVAAGLVLQTAPPAQVAVVLNKWTVRVELGVNTLRDGFDPHSIFSYMAKSGSFESMEPDLQHIPLISAFDQRDML